MCSSHRSPDQTIDTICVPFSFCSLWNEIAARSYVFDRKQLEADEIAKLTQADVIEFYEQHIAHGAPALKQLNIKIESKIKPGEKAAGVKADYVVDDLAKFKSSHPRFEWPEPYTQP